MVLKRLYFNYSHACTYINLSIVYYCVFIRLSIRQSSIPYLMCTYSYLIKLLYILLWVSILCTVAQSSRFTSKTIQLLSIYSHRYCPLSTKPVTNRVVYNDLVNKPLATPVCYWLLTVCVFCVTSDLLYYLKRSTFYDVKNICVSQLILIWVLSFFCCIEGF